MIQYLMDKKFLETAFQTEITNFEVGTIGSSGDGFTSCLLRVKVDFKNGGSQSIIVKRMTEVGKAGKCLEQCTLFTREIEMLQTTLPKLEALLQEALPGLQPLAPRHIYSRKGILVLEDLGTSGFKMLDRREGLDLNQCLLVVKSLARLHAASVILNEKDPVSMATYKSSIYGEAAVRKYWFDFFSGMVRLFAKEVEKWPEYGEKYAKKFRLMADKIMEIKTLESQRDNCRLKVLTHQDVWVNNLLFRGTNDIRIIDFQFAHFASLGNELQFFMCTSLTKEVRENHVDTLLQEYHTTLCSTLTALGYRQPLITLNEVKEEFARSSLYGLAIAVVFLPAVLSTPDCDVDLYNEKGFPPDESIYEDSSFRDTIRDMLSVFKNQGAFDLAEKYLR